ncbi:helix-turn-helix transcriptional regulator [Actinophytocola gossypii]|uniref:Helix-turn-helix transcriptional regulator n=1 Tax=Actinophytocola gossypii TaxID=2812003 RepID=A0ABT2JG30_9PSEU|nr:AraC family transcriptional regulator [Actinophytocola gossypii]MCT2586821.1 helix-turn-helix transcriptional regulator [Actinophytocola gossypii]
MQPAVERAITLIRDRYADPITLDDLSAEVFVSRFHLTRIFKRATGVTPGRYLTAVRLFEAKRLLLTTSRTVSDIVGRVGYNSLGTFTSRFTRAVGMTPTQYRDPRVGELLLAVAPGFARLPPLRALRVPARPVRTATSRVAATITGTLAMPARLAPANVLVGVFDDRIPQRGPVAFQALRATDGSRFEISHVPPGRWTLLAVAERHDRTAPPHIAAPTDQVTTAPGANTTVHVELRSLRPTDPPIAITLSSPSAAADRHLRVA